MVMRTHSLITIKKAMEKNEIIRHLDAIDNKCAALLQLSGIVLTVGALPALGAEVSGYRLVLSAVIAIVFLLNCLASLSVLWYAPEPDEVLFKKRNDVYRFCVCLTATGLILIGILFFATLFA